MFDIKADTQPIDRSIASIVVMGGRLDDWQTFFESDVEPLFYDIEEKLFASQGGSGSHGRWQDLSEGYRKYKDLHWPGRSILVRDDILRKSLTVRGAPYQLRIVEKHMVVLGTTDPKAKYHAQLDGGGKDIIPQRRPLDMTEADVRQITVEKGVAWVVRQTKQSFERA